MTGNFPRKRMNLEQESFDSLVERVCNEAAARIGPQNAILRAGCPDSPYLPAAVSLGKENQTSNVPVYKINVPGYFYRQHYRGAYTSRGYTGMLLTNDPAKFKLNTDILLYCAGEDSTGNENGQMNNMYPILPGLNTYCVFPRDGNIPNGNETKELFFVPCVVSAGLNIRPSDMCLQVGTITNPELKGYTTDAGSLAASIFGGNTLWKTKFKSLCGWNVYDEGNSLNESQFDNLKCVDAAGKTAFLQARKRMLLDFGAPADYIKTSYPAYNV